ncbi:hypothetical protein ACFYKX_04670 [Cytobacillus sp. FJAT-54145]|uniref:Uncharacterized protein n=1 Tax=Cytobacillus spartinae TaxID=3299023 RepID=A0ABW6K6U0_9BACI
MYRAKDKKFLFIPLLIVLIALSACTQSQDFELYEGKPLRIAVVGELPDVKEEQVRFDEISLDEISSEEVANYDAVIITEEHLHEASESQYADVYLNSTIHTSLYLLQVMSLLL